MISDHFHQIRFRIGDYSDALYFTDAEWDAKPDVEGIAKARYVKWQASIEEAKKAPEPDKATVLADIDSQIAVLMEQREIYGK